jgi:hypothetical protein
VNNLRALSYLIFIYTCVEGLVINIMYPNTLPFIFKDFAIVAAYAALMSGNQGRSGTLSKLTPAFGAFALLTLLFLLMPSQIGLLGMLVAVKQRLLYIPLAYVGYHFLRDERDYFSLMRVMAITSIPVSIFGIYLYFVGPAGLTTLGAKYSAIIGSTSGSHGISFWRVPSTFTSPGQFGIFLLANGAAFLGVLFGDGASAKQRTLTIAAMVILIAALMVSGSRAPLLMLLVIAAAMLIVTGRLGGIGMAAAGGYIVFAVAFSYFGGGVEDRVGSIASWEHVERFRDTYFGQLFLQFLEQSPMGFGLGRATIGARHFNEWNNVMLVESYLGIIAAEMGFLGLAVFGWLMAAIVAALLKMRKAMATSPMNLNWLSLMFFVASTIGMLPIGTPLDASPGNLYFWFFLGLIVKMYDRHIAGSAVQTPEALPGAAAVPPPAYLGFR